MSLHAAEQSLKTDSGLIKYQLIKSKKRKTVSISILRSGMVKVNAPAQIAAKEIERLVNDKSRWISEKIDFFANTCASLPKREYKSGETFKYMGRDLLLKVICSGEKKVFVEDGQLVATAQSQQYSPTAIKNRIVEFYRAEALNYLSKRCEYYAQQMGLRYKDVSVRLNKNTWGCCYSDGRIRFNLKLLMTPPEIIDYVVIHELCHLVHQNHSSRFWDLVSRHYPEYKAAIEHMDINRALYEL